MLELVPQQQPLEQSNIRIARRLTRQLTEA